VGALNRLQFGSGVATGNVVADWSSAIVLQLAQNFSGRARSVSIDSSLIAMAKYRHSVTDMRAMRLIHEICQPMRLGFALFDSDELLVSQLLQKR
jgi:hypothetical protein